MQTFLEDKRDLGKALRRKVRAVGWETRNGKRELQIEITSSVHLLNSGILYGIVRMEYEASQHRGGNLSNTISGKREKKVRIKKETEASRTYEGFG